MSLADEARSVRERIVARLDELEPLVCEYNELQKIAAEMGLERTRSAASAAPGGREPRGDRAGRSRSTRRTRTTGARPRPAADTAGAEVVARVLAAVRADPGKTVAEYAESLEVAPATLYRPVRELTSGGTIVKRARQLFPA